MCISSVASLSLLLIRLDSSVRHSSPKRPLAFPTMVPVSQAQPHALSSSVPRTKEKSDNFSVALTQGKLSLKQVRPGEVNDSEEPKVCIFLMICSAHTLFIVFSVASLSSHSDS